MTVVTPKRMALVDTLLQEQKVESIDELYFYVNP
jgi:Fe2+ or Zn2+ uptake regulation protein